MNYEAIVQRIKGRGVQEFDQSQEAIANRINIDGGVCRALVIMWLRSKKDNTSFWAGRDTVEQPLLADIQRLKAAVNLQAEYAAVNQSRFIPDAATVAELQQSGLKYAQGDVTASAQAGFAQQLPNDEPTKIVSQILGARSRFFILSVQGSSGAHSIGIHRPYSLIGKSSDAYVFDPNIGEFCATAAPNVRTLLIEINSLGYESIRVDLNKSYILWAFSG